MRDAVVVVHHQDLRLGQVVQHRVRRGVRHTYGNGLDIALISLT